MSPAKNSKNMFLLDKIFPLTFLFLVFAVASAQAQVTSSNTPSGDGISLAPGRVELEMKPGTETTLVINLDYRSTSGAAQPARIVASLNDWDITRDGRIEFYKSNTRPNSAGSWLIYSPAETTVSPGKIHSIRVTVSVPPDAAPGDHLTALIIEQRPDTIKFNQNARQMVVRYRMASVFYIKVPQLTRRGTLENLQAEADSKGIVITPTLKNEGNSVIRPTASVMIIDAAGKIVAELKEIEPLPLLGGSTTSQPLLIENTLRSGTYSVKYRIDFHDGDKPTEGITDLILKDSIPQKVARQLTPDNQTPQNPN
jgi:hypothetical protein